MNSVYKKIGVGICLGITFLGSSIMYIDFSAKSAYNQGKYKKTLQYSLMLKDYLKEHEQIYMNAGAQELFSLGMYKMKTGNEPHFEEEHEKFMEYIAQESKKKNKNAEFIDKALISQVYADPRIMEQIDIILLEDMKTIESNYEHVVVDQKEKILDFAQGIFFYNQIIHAGTCLTEELDDKKLVENKKIFDIMLEYEQYCDPNKIREMQGEYRYEKLYVELIQAKFDYTKMLYVYSGKKEIKNTTLADNMRKQLYESIFKSHDAINSSGNKTEEIQYLKEVAHKLKYLSE